MSGFGGSMKSTKYFWREKLARQSALMLAEGKRTKMGIVLLLQNEKSQQFSK